MPSLHSTQEENLKNLPSLSFSYLKLGECLSHHLYSRTSTSYAVCSQTPYLMKGKAGHSWKSFLRLKIKIMNLHLSCNSYSCLILPKNLVSVTSCKNLGNHHSNTYNNDKKKAEQTENQQCFLNLSDDWGCRTSHHPQNTENHGQGRDSAYLVWKPSGS